MRARILVVEDEGAMAEALAFNLEAEGYGVEIARDGAAGLERWRAADPDLVVLDVMLPRLSGFDVCRTARLEGHRTPVLFLSAKGEPEDRVAGLEAGGDDYLTKPFHLKEFLLRVAGMLRRTAWFRAELEGAGGREFSFGGHVVSFEAWTARLRDGRTETLGEREAMILKLFVERAGSVVSRDEILDRVWGQDAFPSSRTVDNFIARLRKLFEPDPSSPAFIHTVWGVGYRFTPEGGSESAV